LQCIAALYRLTQRGEVAAGERQYRETDTLGLAHWRCEGCDEQDERGCGLPGRERPAPNWLRIDDTGDDAHDKVRTCPAALRVREPVLAQAIAELGIWEAAGGLGYLGGTPAELPPRLPWLWAAYQGVKRRFAAEVERAAARVVRIATKREIDARGLNHG
jgi:hypothetical protein